MRIKNTILLITTLIFFLVISYSSFGDNKRDDQPFILNANKIINKKEQSLIIAEGNVEIIQGKEVLRADYLEFDRKTDKAIAKGNVSILDENGVIYFADYAEIDKGFQNGLTKNISILFPDNSRLAATKGKRFKGQISKLKKALYSACDCEDPNKKPTWQIKAKEVTHDSNRKKITYKNAFLEFLGFPVAYAPYYSHPDPSVKRQSGFLFPKYSNNSELGTVSSTPYYFALSPHKDLTIEPIYVSKQRPVLFAQYRQNFLNGELSFEGSFTNADKRTRSATYSNKNRGHFFLTGNFDHNDFWRYGFNIKRATDDTYISRYMFEGGADRLNSNFYVEGFDERSYFFATGIATQNQSSAYESRKTPLILPSINHNYRGNKTQIGYISLDSNFSSLTRREGADIRKISFEPSILYPFKDKFGNRFSIKAETSISGYMLSHVSRTGSPDYKGYKYRVHPQFLVNWDLPLQKNKNNNNYFLKPMAALVLAPNRGDDSLIPNEDSQSFSFDETDLFNASLYPGNDKLEKSNQRIDYGLNFKVDSKKTKLNTDFFVGQSVRLRKNNNFSSQSGLSNRWSDIVGKVGFGYGEKINLSYSFLFNKDRLNTRRSEITLSTQIYNNKINIGYLYLEPTSGITDERNEFRFSTIQTINDNYSLRYSIREDLSKAGGMLGQSLALKFNNECFTTELSLNRSYYLDREIKPNDTFLVTFIFKTLGTFSTGRNISN